MNPISEPFLWSEKSLLEVKLVTDDSFLKVRETLTRIGISTADNTLFQSCHIKYRGGRYYICHFKEMYMLDGRTSDITVDDINRRNVIAKLLNDWGLITLLEPSKVDYKVDTTNIRIVLFKDKHLWNLVPKYYVNSEIKK